MKSKYLNGMTIYANREYSLRQTADALNVTFAMVKKYVHVYRFLQTRLINPRMAVISGEQIVYFAEHKQEMFMVYRRNKQERAEQEYLKAEELALERLEKGSDEQAGQTH